MKITDDIFLVDGAEFDSNCYLIAEKLLVDCGSGLFFQQTVEQIKRYKVDIKSIEKIILTHAHFDHCGAVEQFKKINNAEILIHENDAAVLQEGSVGQEAFQENFKGFKQDRLLKEGDKMKIGKYIFEVLHTPGHSQGSICLYEPSGILISGDLLFADGFGRTDLSGGSASQLQQSLRRIKNLNIKILLPGHGTPLNAENRYSGFMIKKILSQIK